MARALDKALFDAITGQLRAKAIRVKTGTLVDATIIASASEDDGEAHWVKHKGKRAVHGFKAHVGADAETALVEEIAVTPANVNDGKAGSDALPADPGDVFADSALPRPALRRCRSREGRHAAHCRHRHVGSRRGGNAGSSEGLEPVDPSRACAGREDLRHLETQLRFAPDAMARTRRSRRPGSPHRHRLQPQAYIDHPCSHRLTDPPKRR